MLVSDVQKAAGGQLFVHTAEVQSGVLRVGDKVRGGERGWREVDTVCAGTMYVHTHTKKGMCMRVLTRIHTIHTYIHTHANTNAHTPGDCQRGRRPAAARALAPHRHPSAAVRAEAGAGPRYLPAGVAAGCGAPEVRCLVGGGVTHTIQ